MQFILPLTPGIWIIIIAMAVKVSACEGDCIVGITTAFVRNFTYVLETVVLPNIALEMNTKLFGGRLNDNPILLLSPLLSAYEDEAYELMRVAIFPSFFHGKCQRPGPNGELVNPPGCPNPDCPVICGTPGSMVHFYSKLRTITIDSTTILLDSLTKPGSAPYREVLEGVQEKRKHIHPKADRRWRNDFDSIMKNVRKKLEKHCQEHQPNELARCSWEKAMKSYILSFP